MKKGEIWYADLTAGTGHEQKGRRPTIILGCCMGMVTIIPLTSNTDTVVVDHTHHILPTKANGLTRDSVALIFQITSYDKTRLTEKIGQISPDDQQQIDTLIKNYMCIQ